MRRKGEGEGKGKSKDKSEKAQGKHTKERRLSLRSLPLFLSLSLQFSKFLFNILQWETEHERTKARGITSSGFSTRERHATVRERERELTNSGDSTRGHLRRLLHSTSTRESTATASSLALSRIRAVALAHERVIPHQTRERLIVCR